MRLLKALGALALLLAASAAYAQTSVSGTPTNRTTVNRSAVITTGNTFQTVLAATDPGADVPRRSLTIQNNNASDSCWVYVGSGTATKATSILLTTGGSYVRYWPYVPNDVIQATCASNSDTLYVDTQ